ncbi:PilZ domain-containing protein [Geobacter sp. AOG1]|uniref:PilZ domain-containing protein n=1 Tax=Geobacter sp. AOG1 TaxID=1566346 RepID=UPI001CC4DCEE|nr:hypothetical protein AOG1_02920 [Geobacter sp. AOG1]
MREHRHHCRVDCEENCRLYLEDWYYPAKVKNISYSGALLNISVPHTDIHVGDNCEFRVEVKPLHEYSCKVVRVEPSSIALTFNEIRKL